MGTGTPHSTTGLSRCIGNNDGKGIGRRDEELSSKNHVAVTVTVGSSAKRGDRTGYINLVPLAVKAHGSDEFLGVGEVGVSVAAVEIILGDVV